MVGFFNALSACLVLLMIMSVGYFMGAAGWMTAKEKKFVSKYIVNIAVPCNCIVGLLNNLDRDSLFQAGAMVLAGVVSVLACMLLSAGLALLLRLPQARWGVFVAMAGFSNTLFIGIPVCTQLFGEASMPYIMLYYISHTTFMQSVGVILVERAGTRVGEKSGLQGFLKDIFSKPPILSVLFSILLLLLKLRPPETLMRFASYISGSVSPLALIYCGFIVYEVGLKNLKPMPGLPAMLVMRLVVAPVVCLTCCSLMGMEGAPVELYQEFMADISDEIDRESKIIDDLLSLVKMDKSSSDQINVATMSINSLMEVILKRLRPIAKKRNIEVIFESIREVSADVDEVKISLAFNNLVENAIKYNVDNGWVKVTLDADHKSFSVTVEDSGIGIPEEFREHIFERFYRVDKARSRETGGTGLGLSITKSVILMHKGTIKVESREGEGTTFVVRIPLSYIPSGPKKGGAAISGTPKNSPALKGFWIGGGLSAKKGQPGADARILGNPAAERKEGRE